ncbi:hypothetical protein [Paraburkholderia youngii]|uniref:hypothetical protein n=1 Tax=Paraburkholderia youngii TaxID=2782701 RepID=UPI003D251970
MLGAIDHDAVAALIADILRGFLRTLRILLLALRLLARKPARFPCGLRRQLACVFGESWRMRMSSIMRLRNGLTVGWEEVMMRPLLKNQADCLIRQHKTA